MMNDREVKAFQGLLRFHYVVGNIASHQLVPANRHVPDGYLVERDDLVLSVRMEI
jgi:hypothetical protein